MEEEGTDALEVAAQENEKAQESKALKGLIVRICPSFIFLKIFLLLNNPLD